jgi:hypothetical protein
MVEMKPVPTSGSLIAVHMMPRMWSSEPNSMTATR